MQIDVGTTPVALPVNAGDRPAIQVSTGGGDIFIDFDSAVSSETGFKIEAGEVYEFPTDVSNKTLYAVATQASTDVRILVVG